VPVEIELFDRPHITFATPEDAARLADGKRKLLAEGDQRRRAAQASLRGPFDTAIEKIVDYSALFDSGSRLAPIVEVCGAAALAVSGPCSSKSGPAAMTLGLTDTSC
jgi:hypothetical protein